LREGLLQLANRLLRAASAQERVAEIAANVRSTGVKGHGQSQGRHRVIVLAGPRKGDAERVVRLHVARVHADGLAVRLDGHGPSLGTIVTTADRVVRLADAAGVADIEHCFHLPRRRLGWWRSGATRHGEERRGDSRTQHEHVVRHLGPSGSMLIEDQPCPLMVGITTRIIWMTAGPMITSISAGKMQKIKGKSSFSGIFAAVSSAFWRRRVRTVSEWTRRDWAMLVPKRSA
jgi:hypothetical protein